MTTSPTTNKNNEPKLFSLDISSINASDQQAPQSNGSFHGLSASHTEDEGGVPHLTLSVDEGSSTLNSSSSSSSSSITTATTTTNALSPPMDLFNSFNSPKHRQDEDEKQLVTYEILKQKIPHDLMILNHSEMKTVGQLGSGAYGIVSKVRYNDETFALKAVHWNHTTQREIEVMHSVKSKYVMNICGVVYSDEDPYSIYLLLDYMNLRSTMEMLQVTQNEPVPEPIIAKMAVQIFRGLRDLHSKRILHRDIKPANVLLNDSGQIKLADFGVSGRINTAQVEFKTTDAFTTFQGTFLFMSPERLRCEPYSYESDIWACAMTLSEYAHGHYPLKDLNDHSIWSVIQKIDNPDFTIPVPKDASVEFQDFIMKSSSFDPKKRSSIEHLMKHPFIEKNLHERPKFVNWLRSEYVKPLKAQNKEKKRVKG